MLNELINILENKEEVHSEDWYALTLEALKLIEILSLLNLEDFQLNQWIFLLDSYNMVKTSFREKERAEMVTKQQPKYFMPYIVALMDKHSEFDFKELEEESGEENVGSPLEEMKQEIYRRSMGSSKKYVS